LPRKEMRLGRLKDKFISKKQKKANINKERPYI
jgi:hypothetical protein